MVRTDKKTLSVLCIVMFNFLDGLVEMNFEKFYFEKKS